MCVCLGGAAEFHGLCSEVLQMGGGYPTILSLTLVLIKVLSQVLPGRGGLYLSQTCIQGVEVPKSFLQPGTGGSGGGSVILTSLAGRLRCGRHTSSSHAGGLSCCKLNHLVRSLGMLRISIQLEHLLLVFQSYAET